MTDQTMVGVGDGRLAAETTPETGTTTNLYVIEYTANLQWAQNTTIVVTNTGVANTLTYDVRVYSHNDTGKPYTTTSNDVVHSDADQVILAKHSKVEVRVKSTVGGAHTTFQIDGISGRM
jgi:hypothetical protein